MHPDPGEGCPTASDCARSFSWCGKTRSSPPPWIQNSGPSSSPPSPSTRCASPGARAPRRVPRGVLARLRRLPEREVARILLQRVRLLLLHLIGALPGERTVARRSSRPGSRRRRRPRTRVRPRSAPRSARRSRPSSRSLADEHRPPRARTRPTSSRYHSRRLGGALRARPRGRVVDLVVDVGDVVDELHGVSPRRSQRASQEKTTNGRALPMWARCRPSGRRRTSRSRPGGGGSSTSAPVSVSWRRTAIVRLVISSTLRARRGAPRRAARPATTVQSSGPRSAPVEREPEDVFRLPPTALSSRTSSRAPASSRRRRLRARSSDEPLERRPRLVAERDAARARGSAARSRAPRPASARREARGRGRAGPPPTAASSSSDIAAIASIASRPRRAASSWTSCSGSPSSSRYGADRRGGHALPSRRSATDACAVRFESFFPSAPSRSPWWTTSGQLPAECPGDPLLHRLVRPVVGAADDVRDPESEIVGDGRELVGGASRPAAASVMPSSLIEPSSSRTAPSPSASCRRLGVAVPALALADRALVPCRSRASRGRRGSPPPSSERVRVRIGVVDRSTSAPPCASAKSRLATA